MCDCLEREDHRTIDLDIICERGDDDEMHSSKDCLDVPAIHPIV